MSRVSIPKRSISTAVAGLVFVSLLAPANATYRRDTVAVFPDLPAGTAADHASPVLTAQLPWLAPIGHRQPRQADVPRPEAVSAWKQQQIDQELDRKLIICRGC
jgi:hypothetical protein